MQSDASRRYREKLRADPVAYEIYKAKRRREYWNGRYRNDPEYRERTKAKSREYYARNKEARNEASRRYHEAHRERMNELNHIRYVTRGMADNLRARLKRYGLTEDQWAALCALDSNCAICSSEGGRKGLVIDHDHVTGKVRGRLCGHCNATLHKLETEPGWIEAATAYLHR